MNAAFIPVRGGSKSIPLKNIKPVCGNPLVYWTVRAACGCKHIDKVYIATDNCIIKETVEAFKNESDLFLKAEVISRSAESASDTASTEFAMLEFAERYEFDNIVLIQATSPLLTSCDLERGFNVFYEKDTDSVISVVPQKRFNWSIDENGFAKPNNYDIYNRPRRQEFDGYFAENGAFYITSKTALVKSKNRISGKIRAVEMDEDTFFEIDEPSDLTIIEELMRKRGMDKEAAMPEIKMLLTDCDGCLTDGGMYYSEKGDELKKFNTRDGMGFARLREKGIITGIVTSENVDLNRRRAEKLKLDILRTGCKDKIAAVREICDEVNISLENVCYIGDDINDLEVIKAVGYGCCPADAVQLVKDAAKYTAVSKGGKGVIREIADKILHKMS